MSGEENGIDVGRAKFFANAQMTIEIPMPSKAEFEKGFGYVPIIRCRNCKHWNVQTDYPCGWCEYNGHYYKPDFYCAYGEREF